MPYKVSLIVRCLRKVSLIGKGWYKQSYKQAAKLSIDYLSFNYNLFSILIIFLILSLTHSNNLLL